MFDPFKLIGSLLDGLIGLPSQLLSNVGGLFGGLLDGLGSQPQGKKRTLAKGGTSGPTTLTRSLPGPRSESKAKKKRTGPFMQKRSATQAKPQTIFNFGQAFGSPSDQCKGPT